MNDWGAIATVVGALLAVVGAIYGVRKTSKVDREKLTQQWATIFTDERKEIALELRDIQATAELLREQLRQVKDEYAQAKIEHRESIAEKNETIRERDATIREQLISVHRTEEVLADTRQELLKCRHELISARALIITYGDYIEEYRRDRIQHGLPDRPVPQIPSPRSPLDKTE